MKESYRSIKRPNHGHSRRRRDASQGIRNIINEIIANFFQTPRKKRYRKSLGYQTHMIKINVLHSIL
jgi:hypothetical protein